MLILNILTPLYLLIGLGIFLRASGVMAREFWPQVEKLAYFVLFPALIFTSLARAQTDLAIIWILFPTVLLPTLACGALQWLGLLSSNIAAPTFSSMFQGAVRNNTSVGLVIAALVAPDSGLVLMVLVMTFMIIFNNITSVAVLARYGDRSASGNSAVASWWRSIIFNPLIISSALGLTANLLQLPLPASLLEALEFLGQAGLPLVLLTIGAGLRFTALRSKLLPLLLPSFAKMIMLPALTYAVCRWLQVDAATSGILLLYAGLPTAMSSYILAGQMGGDRETMAQIISLQIAIAALTLPVLLVVITQS